MVYFYYIFSFYLQLTKPDLRCFYIALLRLTVDVHD
jgi:hypothetical protein